MRMRTLLVPATWLTLSPVNDMFVGRGKVANLNYSCSRASRLRKKERSSSAVFSKVAGCFRFFSIYQDHVGSAQLNYLCSQRMLEFSVYNLSRLLWLWFLLSLTPRFLRVCVLFCRFCVAPLLLCICPFLVNGRLALGLKDLSDDSFVSAFFT